MVLDYEIEDRLFAGVLSGFTREIQGTGRGVKKGRENYYYYSTSTFIATAVIRRALVFCLLWVETPKGWSVTERDREARLKAKANRRYSWVLPFP